MSLDHADIAMMLPVNPTEHTATIVRMLEAAKDELPCEGSICHALALADREEQLLQPCYAEAGAALDVAARVFGYDSATQISADQADAALVYDIAIYHLTGSPADVPAALVAFRRAAGPLLDAA